MDASLWVAKTGLNAQQTRMSVISNNLANVNTKRLQTRSSRVRRSAVPKHSPSWRSNRSRHQRAEWFHAGHRYSNRCNGKNVGQGNMVATENALDLAVEGPGLFRFCSRMAPSPTPVMAASSFPEWRTGDQLWLSAAAANRDSAGSGKYHGRYRWHG